MSDYAQEMWLWSHLSMLSIDGGEADVEDVLTRLSDDDARSLLRTGLTSMALMGRDVTGPHTGMSSVVAWLQHCREGWAPEALDGLWRRSQPLSE